MKNILLLIIIFLFFSSCKEEEDLETVWDWDEIMITGSDISGSCPSCPVNETELNIQNRSFGTTEEGGPSIEYDVYSQPNNVFEGSGFQPFTGTSTWGCLDENKTYDIIIKPTDGFSSKTIRLNKPLPNCSVLIKVQWVRTKTPTGIPKVIDKMYDL